MKSRDRWNKAQSYEKGFWERAAFKIQTGVRPPLNYHKWRAENFMNLASKAFDGASQSYAEARVLEVGSGPVGAVSFLNAKERIAVDPLCDYYATKPELVAFRNPEVSYQSSRGEELQFESNSFDLVIIENVIDHVQNAEGVMREIHRVLKPSGTLYLTVNVHTRWGAFLHEILAALKIDKGHPYTFTIKSIKAFLTRQGFDIRYVIWEDYRECQQNNLKSPALKYRLIGATGLSEFLFSSISLKSS